MSAPDPWQQHLIHCFHNLYFRLEKLKNELEKTRNLKEVRRKVINEIKRMHGIVNQYKGNTSKEQRNEVSYVMTVFADEMMIYSRYRESLRWEDHLLEELFFQSHRAGNRIFRRIEHLIRNYNDNDLGMISIYFLAIALGFKGQYRDNNKQTLSRTQTRLYRLIRSTDPTFPHEMSRLFPQAYKHSHTNNPTHQPGNFKIFYLLTIAGFIAAFSAYLFFSNDQSLQILTEMAATLVELIWENRIFISLLVCIVLIAMLLGKICFYSISSFSRFFYMRLALRKLFSMLRSDIHTLDTKLHCRHDLSHHLFLYAEQQKENETTPSSAATQMTSQRQLVQKSGMKLVSSHAVDMEVGNQQFCGYSLFSQGAIIDLPLKKDHSLSGDLFFFNMLKHLKRLRPNRPVDSLLVSMPYQLLIPPTPAPGAPDAPELNAPSGDTEDALLGWVDVLNRKIRLIQQQAQINLPVYIVITGCEQIEGFKEFVSRIPTEYRGQIFGWSNPDSYFAYGREDYANDAFNYLRSRLIQIQFHLFSYAQDDLLNQKIIHFSRRFSALERPLSKILKALSQRSQAINGEIFFFRGLYFSGMGQDVRSKDSNLFIRSLMQEKVLPESALGTHYLPTRWQRITLPWAIFSGKNIS